MEICPDDSSVLVNDANVIKKEIGDALTVSKFAPICGGWFDEHKRTQPGFVDGQRSENRGFWYGSERIDVEMYLDLNSIVLLISSDQGGRRAVVEGIRAKLERSVREKHPDLKVYVKSYSDFPFWGP